MYQLEHQLQILRERLTQEVETQQSVMDLLNKADARRIKEPKDHRKWNEILDNLERSLDLAKARISQTKQEIDLLIRKIENETSSTYEDDEKYWGSATVQSPLKDFKAVSNEAAQRIIELPIDEISRLTLDQVDQMHRQISAENAAASESSKQDDKPTVYLPPEDELYEEELDEQSTSKESRSQIVLRNAIAKIQAHRLDSMTAEEIKLTIACYNKFVKIKNPSPRDERLCRIIGAAIKILKRKMDGPR